MTKTPQQQREALMMDLQRAMIIALGVGFGKNHDYQPLMTIWLHFTDWYDDFSLDELLSEDCLIRDTSQHYVPDGTWRDKFPPLAYKLSVKGFLILTNKGQWVYEGTLPEYDLNKLLADKVKKHLKP